MSMLLNAELLEKSFARGPLFRRVSLRIHEGDRVALIGPNGSGKSTLLKILAGLETPDHGQLTSKRNLRVAYVAQQERFDPESSAIDIVTHAMEAIEDDAHQRHVQAARLLGKVGFDDPHQSAGSLSGGWRKRLAIAQALARQPDLLLMDEPTNHLDLEGIWWLESFLTSGNLPFGLVVVTHDRYFLQAIAKRVVELSSAYPDGTFEVQGDYSEFLERRQDFLEGQAKQQQALAGKVRQDIAWLSRGAKARRTKAKGRIREAGDRMEELADLRQRNAPAQAAQIAFSATGRQTRKLLTTQGLGHAMGGRQLFSNVDLELAPGDCLSLLGVNGSGKTTLIRLLTGDLQPDQGSVHHADNLRVVTFTQHRETLDPAQKLRDALCPVSDTVQYMGRPIHVVTWAQKFLFTREQLNVSVGDLSGGEQSRILIARLMLQPADLLILDEPTNDLDIASLEVLEESLSSFPGAIVLVSHDRYLVDRLSTQILGLDGQGGAHAYPDYFQWEAGMARLKESLKEKQSPRQKQPTSAMAADTDAATSVTPESTGRKSRKLSYKEQREWDQMEETILAAEVSLAQAQQATLDPETLADHIKLAQACHKLEAAQSHVDHLYTRWQELEAIQQGE